ncbi:hypothetical protein ACSSVW_003213 [Pseudoalteromonas sp. MBR-15]|uniref:Uncharacterized protein n=1 Tax=Pseudoalteromonas lipolytica TaxID=570156 RepID=A0ABY1GGV6_9GAMM|nr:hypothetical protein SAMN04487854_107116 [Pseudoalteromonas lipolytica]
MPRSFFVHLFANFIWIDSSAFAIISPRLDSILFLLIPDILGFA